jgi:hypothetical protein
MTGDSLSIKTHCAPETRPEVDGLEYSASNSVACLHLHISSTSPVKLLRTSFTRTMTHLCKDVTNYQVIQVDEIEIEIETLPAPARATRSGGPLWVAGGWLA